MERTGANSRRSAKWKTAGWVLLLLILGVGVGLAVYYLTPLDDDINIKSDGTPVKKANSKDVAKTQSDGEKSNNKYDSVVNEIKERHKKSSESSKSDTGDDVAKPKLDTPKDVQNVLVRDVNAADVDQKEEPSNVTKAEEGPTKDEVKSILEEGSEKTPKDENEPAEVFYGPEPAPKGYVEPSDVPAPESTTPDAPKAETTNDADEKAEKNPNLKEKDGETADQKTEETPTNPEVTAKDEHEPAEVFFGPEGRPDGYVEPSNIPPPPPEPPVPAAGKKAVGEKPKIAKKPNLKQKRGKKIRGVVSKLEEELSFGNKNEKKNN